MQISGTGNAGVAQALEVKSAQLAKGQQEQEGKAALELLESAEAPKVSPGASSGSVINTYA